MGAVGRSPRRGPYRGEGEAGAARGGTGGSQDGGAAAAGAVVHPLRCESAAPLRRGPRASRGITNADADACGRRAVSQTALRGLRRKKKKRFAIKVSCRWLITSPQRDSGLGCTEEPDRSCEVRHCVPPPGPGAAAGGASNETSLSSWKGEVAVSGEGK